MKRCKMIQGGVGALSAALVAVFAALFLVACGGNTSNQPSQVKSRLRASINLLPDSSLPGFADVVLATQ